MNYDQTEAIGSGIYLGLYQIIVFHYNNYYSIVNNELTLILRLSNYYVKTNTFLWLNYRMSSLNHDCRPNCVPIFIGKDVLIKAVKDIKDGEEVVSYILLIIQLYNND